LKRTRGTDAASVSSGTAQVASADAAVQIDRLKEALRRLQVLHSSESAEAGSRLREMQRDRDEAAERAAGLERAAAEVEQLRRDLSLARAQIEELSQVSRRG
jgi:hypothetical protein